MRCLFRFLHSRDWENVVFGIVVGWIFLGLIFISMIVIDKMIHGY